MLSKKPLIILTLLVLSLGGLSACSGNGAAPEAGVRQSPADPSGRPMADVSTMPEDIQKAPATVQSAYSFAVANPGIVKRLPCYCGCGAMGHKSLYACYVSNAEPNGKITYDTHALGCQICVDIAQDAMRLTSEGQSVDQIKTYVDETYSKYGASNLP